MCVFIYSKHRCTLVIKKKKNYICIVVRRGPEHAGGYCWGEGVRVNLAIIIAILSGLTESSDGFDYVLVVDDLMIAGYSFNLPNMRIFINTTFHKEENRKKTWEQEN